MKTIELTQDKVSIVSDDNYELVSKYTWYAKFDANADTWYAVSQPERGKYIYMHRLILGLPAGDSRVADHKDHDGLNNTNENLRIVTHSQNGANSRKKVIGSSRYKGVHYHQSKWVARITVNYQQIHLGRFDLEEDAAKAYDIAAKEHFGEFAKLNFSDG